jgi:MerR family redox-sensitive transcriptional activator SoxR
MKKLSIGIIAKRAGIKASAIRYYESEGLLPKVGRQAGRRVYDESILDQLRFIDLSKRSGFHVAEIRRLVGGFARSDPPGVRWRALADKKMEDLDRRIEEARSMKRWLDLVAECECPTFRDCGRSLCPESASGGGSENSS